MQQLLQDLLQHPHSRLVFRAARELGRDPLAALGLSENVVLTPDLALLVMRLADGDFEQQMQKDEQARAFDCETTVAWAWEEALPGGDGYDGPRVMDEWCQPPKAPPKVETRMDWDFRHPRILR